MANRTAETTYVHDVVGAQSKQAAPLKLNVCATTPVATKSGVAEVDTEVIVAQRALARLRRFSEEPNYQLELDILQRSLARLGHAVREATGTPHPGADTVEDPEPTSLPALPSSPAQQQRLLQRRRHRSILLDPELRARRAKAVHGAWGVALKVAARLAAADRPQRIELGFDDDRIHDWRDDLQREANAFGLLNLSARIAAVARPVIAVSVVPAPDALDSLAAPSTPASQQALLTTLRPGLVAALQAAEVAVTATASSRWGSCKAATILSKGVAPFMTANTPDSFVAVDLFDAVVHPTAYGFSSIHHIIPGYFPRAWDLHGSMDGKAWTLLRRHEADHSFAPRTMTCMWPIAPSRADDGAPALFRYFRVQQTAENSTGSHELQISGLELYGVAMAVEAPERPALRLARIARPTFALPDPLSPALIPKKKPAKK